MVAGSVPDRLYELVTDEDDASDPDTEGIAPEAAADAPRNFSLNAANGACTKLAEQLASPGAVLPLLIGVVGAPVGLVGLLEPIRRGGSLIPQLAIAGRIRARRIRKGFWAAAGFIQAAALALMLLAAAAFEGLAAGLVIVAALALFSIASGVGSVAFGDVVGKTIPESKRGQLLAFRATAGGALTLTAGPAIAGLSRSDDLGIFLGLLGVAAVLWFAPRPSRASASAARPGWSTPLPTGTGRSGSPPPHPRWPDHPLLRGGFRFDAADERARFECRIDRRRWRACSSPRRYELGPGKHRFRVRSKNRDGRSAARNYRFRVKRR